MKLKKEETRIDVHKGQKVYRILIKDIMANLKKNEEVLLVGID